jgi:hypothetical protein
MEMRPIGRTGIDVAPLEFGGNAFGRTMSAEAAMRLFDAFIAEGFNLVDTVDVYSPLVPGNSGRWRPRGQTPPLPLAPYRLFGQRAALIRVAS